MAKAIILRHSLAILLGCVSIAIMTALWDSAFDKVASTSLFGCIISVANEDESLGPVIHKAINRFSGAFLGGICGYLIVLLRQVLPHLPNEFLVIVLPVVFVAMVQTTAESHYVSKKIINKYKMKHFVIQVQVAFGVVYLGDTVDRANHHDSFANAVARTSAILAGVLCLLVASVLSYPETSMVACVTSLDDCLKELGTLSIKITDHRIDGRPMPRYDHRRVLFAAKPKADEQIKLLNSINKKVGRVISLLPHLWLEPLWVPGLPIGLLTAQFKMAPRWTPFLAVVASRVKRIRSSLSAMDSNMRISNDEVLLLCYVVFRCISMVTALLTLMQADKELTEEIAERMKKMISSVSKGLNLVGEFIMSPFRPDVSSASRLDLWRGKIDTKGEMIAASMKIQTRIEQFAVTFEDSIQKNHMTLPHRAHEQHKSSLIKTQHKPSFVDFTRNNFRVNKYTTRRTVSHRAHLGHTLDYYFKTGPRRTFCNLSIQVAIQATSLIMEAVDFIDCIDDKKEDGHSVEEDDNDQEASYVPLRSISGLRLAEEEAKVEEQARESITMGSQSHSDGESAVITVQERAASTVHNDDEEKREQVICSQTDNKTTDRFSSDGL